VSRRSFLTSMANATKNANGSTNPQKFQLIIKIGTLCLMAENTGRRRRLAPAAEALCLKLFHIGIVFDRRHFELLPEDSESIVPILCIDFFRVVQGNAKPFHKHWPVSLNWDSAPAALCDSPEETVYTNAF